MKNQALVSSKEESKKLKRSLLQFLFGALRVKEKNYAAVLYFFLETTDKIIPSSR